MVYVCTGGIKAVAAIVATTSVVVVVSVLVLVLVLVLAGPFQDIWGPK